MLSRAFSGNEVKESQEGAPKNVRVKLCIVVVLVDAASSVLKGFPSSWFAIRITHGISVTDDH